jgi:hypothetical protein
MALALRNFAVNLMSVPLVGKRLVSRSLSDRLELPDYEVTARPTSA